MGSGNSRAEGIAVAVRIQNKPATIDLYPLYVKNRDPRINYQTRVLTGAGVKHLFDHLKASSFIQMGSRLNMSLVF
jgi:hypothetical protein